MSSRSQRKHPVSPGRCPSPQANGLSESLQCFSGGMTWTLISRSGSLELVQKEQEEQQSTASLPVQRNDLPVAGGPVSPILQLHREIDRLFDDAFRGFGFPTLAMPRWPSDWLAC